MKKFFGKLLVVSMAVLLCAMLIGTFYFSVGKPYTEYLRHKKSAVAVQAEVSKIVVYTDSDDDERYEIYVTYSYENKLYENIYWETRANEDFYKGEKTDIRIDPENPAYILKTDLGGRAFACFLCVIAVAVAVLVFESHFYKEKYHEDKKRITTKMIANNLSPLYITATANAFFFAAAGYLGGKFFMPDLCSGTTFVKFMLIAGILFLLLALYFILRISKTGYRISIHTCKVNHSDYDGESTSYYTVFDGMEDAVREAKIYKRVQEGCRYYVVMNQKNKVREVYSTADWILDVDESEPVAQTGFLVFRLFAELLAGALVMTGIVGILAYLIHNVLL